MDKQGLVAPVWSDAGGVTYTVTIDEAMWPWSVGGVRVKPSYSFEGIKWPTFDFTPPKVSTAKDALPAYRVMAGKRGPGWCDE